MGIWGARLLGKESAVSLNSLQANGHFVLFIPPPRSAALCDNNIAVIMVCDPDIAFPQRWLMAIVIFQNCLYKQHTESSTKRILMSSAKLFLSQATFLQSIVDTWTFVWPGCTVLCYEFLM